MENNLKKASHKELLRKTSEKGATNRIDEFDLAKRVKYLRDRRDLSQEQLARLSNVSQSTIAQIEGGKKDPSMTTIKKLCRALDIEMATLFAGDRVHVFDLNRLRSRYKSVEDLNATLYRALGEVIRYADDIGFIKK